MHPVRRKWRPGLGLVILAVLALVLCLPIAGLFLFRFYANQLVQQTEESLLMQAAVLTAAYEQLYRDAAEVTDTPQLPAISPQTRSYQPLFPSVTMNPQAILPPRPDPLPATEAIGAAYTQIGPQLSLIALRAQEQTLAGYRFLDRHGTVIAGSAEDGTYLGHVNEVAMALNGDVASVARTRVRPAGEPLLYRLSQGTRVRIFVAMPAMVGDDIIGVVYLSRTPNHIFRFLYGERWNLLQAAVFVLLSTGAIGFVFWRFVSQPIRALIRRTDEMQAASRWEPLEHYGTREVETLARSFQALTERLHHQRDTLTTYTAHVSHEMKSPLTSIKGAAELMQDDMPPEVRARFLDNIRADAARIEDLLARMRDYSAVGAETLRGECIVRDIVPSVTGLNVSVTPEEATAPIPGDVLAMVLTHLLENATDHGATSVQIDADANGLTITDDGRGISEGNRARVFEPFFTTRRGAGGTGMGLNIVRSAVEAAGGAITLEPSAKGARFRITFQA